MFLIISEIYLFLFRTHVKVGSGILIGCDFLYNMSSLFFIQVKARSSFLLIMKNSCKI